MNYRGSTASLSDEEILNIEFKEVEDSEDELNQ